MSTQNAIPFTNMLSIAIVTFFVMVLYQVICQHDQVFMDCFTFECSYVSTKYVSAFSQGFLPDNFAVNLLQLYL